MKNSLITLFALAGAASAEASLTLLPDLNDTNFYFINGDKADKSSWFTDIGGGSSVTDKVMTANLNAIAANKTTPYNPSLDTWDFRETGWRWSVGKLNYPGEVNKSDFIKDENDNKVGFRFKGKLAYKGTFAVATRRLSDLLEPDIEKLTSLSISFVATGQQDIGFSAWVWDGTQATALIEETKALNVDVGTVNTFTVGDLSLGSDETILFLWNEYDSESYNTITSLTSSYTTEIIPEPATATLSLLALACLAARRRRASL